MRLDNEFTVDAPLERTWRTLLDLGRVAGCLPGATVEPVGEEGLYRGQLKMKVGPVNMSYSGTVRLLDVDVDEHVATFEARAKETRGTGTAAAQIRNRLEPAGSGTRVRVETNLDVTGRPAQFGRGLMEDVASKMLGDFSERLEQLVLAAEPVTVNGGGPPPVSPASSASESALRGSGSASSASSATNADAGQLDLGSVLLRGYGRQLASGGIVAALAAAALCRRRRRRRGFELIVRYRK